MVKEICWSGREQNEWIGDVDDHIYFFRECLLVSAHVSLTCVHLAFAGCLSFTSSSINVYLPVQIQWAHPPTLEIWIICNNEYFVGSCSVSFIDLLDDGPISCHGHGVHVPPSLLSTSPSAHIWDMPSVTRLPLYSLMLSPLAAQTTISRPDAPVSWQLLIFSNTGRGRNKWQRTHIDIV